MPNHIHDVIQIHDTNVGATLAVALDTPDTPDAPRAVAASGATTAQRATVKVAPTDGVTGVMVTPVTVGCIVGAYKSLVFKKYHCLLPESSAYCHIHCKDPLPFLYAIHDPNLYILNFHILLNHYYKFPVLKSYLFVPDNDPKCYCSLRRDLLNRHIILSI